MVSLADALIVFGSQVSTFIQKLYDILHLWWNFQIIFFLGGWIFFVKQLFRDYEVRNVSVQLIFSVTFALSLTMFELIIFEIIGFLESSSRYFHWRLELTLLLMLVIAIIPFYIAFSIISNIRIGIWQFFRVLFVLLFTYNFIDSFLVSKKYVKSLTTLVWFVYLYIFWRIGDPFPLLSVSQGIFTIEQVIITVFFKQTILLILVIIRLFLE